MAAITWRNVDGPRLTDPSRALEAAGKSFTGGFDALSNVLKQREATDAANVVQSRENTTQDMLGQFRMPTSSEDFAARRGDFAAQMRAAGAGANQAGLGKFLDNRTAVLQGRDVDQVTFDNSMTDNREAPQRDNALSLYAQGDFVGGDAAAAGVTRNRAALFEASRLGQRRVVTEGQADTTFADGQAAEAQRVIMRPFEPQTAQSNLDTAANTRRTQNIQANNSTAELGLKQTDARLRTFERLTELASETATKLGKLKSGAIGSEGAMGSLITNLGKVVENKDTVGKVSRQLGDALLRNPQFASLPTSVVEAIALKQTGNVTDWFGSDRTAAMEADLTAALQSQDGTMNATSASRESLASILQQQRLSADQAQNLAFPDLAARIANAPRNPPAAGGNGGLQGLANPEEAPGAAPQAGPTNAAAANASGITPALQEEQLKLEQDELALGMIKSLSKESSDVLNDRRARDREGINNFATGVGSGMLGLGNAFNDIATLPVRAVMGAANTALRVPNAYGAGIPYLPDGGMLSSMTPYSDMQNRRDNAPTTRADVKARRTAFDKTIAAAKEQAKKAR